MSTAARVVLGALTGALALSVTACGSKDEAPKAERRAKSGTGDKAPAAVAVDASGLRTKAAAFFSSPPAEASPKAYAMSDALVNLGRTLYYDKRLSKNHDVSCNSCHDLANYGVDGEPTSPGHKGQRGDRNSPTVYNAAFHITQFWDGRAADVEAQAKGPVLNPIEMAMPSEEVVVATLGSIPGYQEMFKAAFPDSGITYDNMATAIGAFERRLVTPSAFDKFLAGDDKALDDKALRGLQAFLDTGCTQCHTGPALGGTMYQKLGAVKPYDTKDVGRFALTNNEADRHVFKVPSLRNVAKTGPWMHDGSIADLGQMVEIMAKHQTTKGTLSTDEKTHLLAFLDSLTGELPADYIKAPALPESGPETPKPDPT